MPDSIFGSVFQSDAASTLVPGEFLLCLGAALVLGLVLCVLTLQRVPHSRSFTVTLAPLPAVVCVVILAVNGNLGVGVAVAGAFSLIRFRSAPGSAREITALFLAMGTGLLTGMGYLAYAAVFVLVLGGATLLFTLLVPQKASRCRTLRITIPEDLNDHGIFEPVLAQYCSAHTLTQIKTANLGSLYRLTYDVTLREAGQEKALLDAVRCLNGNLEISLAEPDTAALSL